jgi:hypothetical protein
MQGQARAYENAATLMKTTIASSAAAAAHVKRTFGAKAEGDLAAM